MSKKPNKFLAPIVIAGVTIGFLASAYKFVFAKPESKSNLENNQVPEHPKSDTAEQLESE